MCGIESPPSPVRMSMNTFVTQRKRGGRKREEKATPSHSKTRIISFMGSTFLRLWRFWSSPALKPAELFGDTLTFIVSTVNVTLSFDSTSCCCFNILNYCQILGTLFNDYWSTLFFFFNILEILKIENDWKGRGPFIFKYIPNLKDQISPKMRRNQDFRPEREYNLNALIWILTLDFGLLWHICHLGELALNNTIWCFYRWLPQAYWSPPPRSLKMWFIGLTFLIGQSSEVYCNGFPIPCCRRSNSFFFFLN